MKRFPKTAVILWEVSTLLILPKKLNKATYLIFLNQKGSYCVIASGLFNTSQSFWNKNVSGFKKQENLNSFLFFGTSHSVILGVKQLK